MPCIPAVINSVCHLSASGDNSSMKFLLSRRSAVIITFLLSINGFGSEAGNAPEEVNTFSIVAIDPETGDLGVAVQSKFLGVGSVVPWAEAGVGAIATQSYANTTFGPEGLKLLKSGKSASETLKILIDKDQNRESRQVAIVDKFGESAVWTGDRCHGYAGHHRQKFFSVQGNLLASEMVINEMKLGFLQGPDSESAPQSFPRRLIQALESGQSAGGDKRGRQSASLMVVRKMGGYGKFNDRFIDLRVEDHPTPIQELKRLLSLHEKFYRNEHLRKPENPEIPRD